MNTQHFLSQAHLKLFRSGDKSDGRLWVISKSGQYLCRKPVRRIAHYRDNHSSEVEQMMAEVERKVAPVLLSLNGTSEQFSPADLMPVIEYMAMTASRNPPLLDGWEHVLVKEKRRYPRFARQFEEQRNADNRRRAVVERLAPLMVDLLCKLPYWETYTLPGEDDEYFVTDSPVVIGFPGGFEVIRGDSSAYMPISKKTLLIGLAVPEIRKQLTLCEFSVNGNLFAHAAKEVYSHRRLEKSKLKQMVQLAPVIRGVTRANGVQAFVSVEYTFRHSRGRDVLG